MSYGFVYILHNPEMTCFKLGCTERSPHARAEELSKPTGVPSPFKVACYVEVKDFQDVERRMHAWLSEYRVSPQREFFHEYGIRFAVAIMYYLPGVLAFTEVDDDYLGGHLGHPLQELQNPWAPKPQPEFGAFCKACDDIAINAPEKL